MSEFDAERLTDLARMSASRVWTRAFFFELSIQPADLLNITRPVGRRIKPGLLPPNMPPVSPWRRTSQICGPVVGLALQKLLICVNGLGSFFNGLGIPLCLSTE